MRRLYYAFFLLFAPLSSPILATEFDIRPSFYRFNQSSFRDVYGTGAFNIEAELRVPLYSCLWLFVNGEYLEATGKTEQFHSTSTLHLGGTSCGLSLRANVLSNLSVFVGGGAKFFFVKTKDHSPYVQGTTHGTPIGGIVKASLEYLPIKHFILSAFLDYSQAPKQYLYNDYSAPLLLTKIDPGGLCVGASVGVSF